MKPLKQKLYCYVDENGQDTKGDVLGKEGEDMEKLFKDARKEESLIEV